MSEQFTTDTADRLRNNSQFRNVMAPESDPEPEDTDAKTAEDEATQQDEESEESGETRADASEAEGDGEESTGEDAEDAEGGESEGDEAAAAGADDLEKYLPKWAKDPDVPERLRAKIARTERDRRKEQSKAAQADRKFRESDADLARAIDKLQAVLSGTGEASAASEAGEEKVTLESLGFKRDDFLDPEGTEKALQAMQRLQGNTRKSERVGNLQARMRETLESKKDIDEVKRFAGDRALNDHPDFPLLTEVGRYHLARSLMLAEQIETLEKQHKVELAKAKKGVTERRDRLSQQPGEPGGRQKPTTRSTGNDILDFVNRRNDRLGVRNDGTWARPRG